MNHTKGLRGMRRAERARLASEDEAVPRPGRGNVPLVALRVDVAMLTIRGGTLAIGLVNRTQAPYEGRWSLPGKIVGLDEGLEEAAQRELIDETGLESLPSRIHLAQIGAYGDPGRDPTTRVVSVAYVALVRNLPEPRHGMYWPVSAVLESGSANLAFDHSRIIADGVRGVRERLEAAPIALMFLDEPFTLSELRGVYEAVWGSPLDPSNFRRKVLASAGFVQPVAERTSAGRSGGRPPQLFQAGKASRLFPPILRPGLTTNDLHSGNQAHHE